MQLNYELGGYGRGTRHTNCVSSLGDSTSRLASCAWFRIGGFVRFALHVRSHRTRRVQCHRFRGGARHVSLSGACRLLDARRERGWRLRVPVQLSRSS
jgi:hypothetical protein